MGVLAAVDPRDVGGALVGGCGRVEGAEEVESGKDEEGEGHALGVGGSVGGGEVEVEAAEPVFGVKGFVEGGGVWGVHSYFGVRRCKGCCGRLGMVGMDDSESFDKDEMIIDSGKVG